MFASLRLRSFMAGPAKPVGKGAPSKPPSADQKSLAASAGKTDTKGTSDTGPVRSIGAGRSEKNLFELSGMLPNHGVGQHFYRTRFTR
jgi:hypothetical protein